MFYSDTHVFHFLPDTPWGSLPLLYVGNEMVGQSMAVHRYVAEVAGWSYCFIQCRKNVVMMSYMTMILSLFVY